MKYVIERNIPAPESAGKTGRPPVYPFGKMEVGDSFAAPLQNESGASGSGTCYKWDKATCKIKNASTQYGKLHGMKFCVKEMREAGIVRCWRIA